MGRPVVCCEHNRCPDRPRHRLWRFQERPWRCTQCGRWWVTRNEGFGWDGWLHWSWREVTKEAK